MNRQSMRRVLWLGAAVALAVGLCPRAATAQTITNYYYTGGGTAGVWSDPSNWALANGTVSGYPDSKYTRAYFTNTTDVTFSSGVPGTVSQLHTGVGHVTIGRGMSFTHQNPSYGELHVGAGGADFGSGTLSFPNGYALLRTAGHLKAGSTSSGNSGSWEQTGDGVFEITGSFVLPLQGTPVWIRGWRFTNNTPTQISQSTPQHTFRFAGTPVFSPGHRPIWSLGSGSATGAAKWELNGHTMLGGEVRVTAGGSPNSRYSWLIDEQGGVIDCNRLLVGYGTYRACSLKLVGTTVYLRGSGVVYQNLSLNNAGTNLYFISGSTTNIATITEPFSIANGTTFVFAPAGGSCDLQSGSKDRNSAARNPADWENNFAFDTIRIASGATVTLAGDANIEGGGNAALYATSLVGEGAGATVNLNGRNVYLLKSASNVTFTGAGAVYQQSRGTAVLVR